MFDRTRDLTVLFRTNHTFILVCKVEMQINWFLRNNLPLKDGAICRVHLQKNKHKMLTRKQKPNRQKFVALPSLVEGLNEIGHRQ